VTVDYRIGDTADVTATIPDGSVSLVASSPPFIALRSYLPDDHPDKDREMGSEPNPGAFLNRLLALTAEWGRVLAPWGSIAIELGDTYSGSGGSGGDYNVGGLRDGQAKVASQRKTSGWHRGEREGRAPGAAYRQAGTEASSPNGGTGWPRPKCLALIPQAYALSLAYGINVITGQPSPAGQWLVRNVIVWHRPNPAVGALGDKVRPSTSYITVATRSAKRWFDLDAVRTTPVTEGRVMYQSGRADAATGGKALLSHEGVQTNHPAGAPPLDCWFDHHDTWTITTQPSSLAHYAMWPAKLAERLILMMCPAEVCTVCREPRRRIVGRPAEHQVHAARAAAARRAAGTSAAGWRHASGANRKDDVANQDYRGPTTETLGWSDCGHDAYVPGTVLDPFAGTGTTLAVADLYDRDAIGIDLDERNHDLYPARRDECAKALFGTRPELPGQLGMFTEIPA
jgi:hypothetical protein